MKTDITIFATALLFSFLPVELRAQNDDPMEEWLDMGYAVEQIVKKLSSPSDESQYTSQCPFPFKELKTIAVNPSGREYIRQLRQYFPDATIRMTGLPELKKFISSNSDRAEIYVTPDKPVFTDANGHTMYVPQSVVEFEYPDTFKSYFRKPLFVKKPKFGTVRYILVTPIGPFFAKPYGDNSVNFYFFSPKF